MAVVLFDLNSHHHLLQPGRIGTLELKNRMVISAMGINLAEPDVNKNAHFTPSRPKVAPGLNGA
jgi:2,4-dienoyl-CoA reductase-like NADH-dependent reductase (Old Yellow Enzyme family)